MERTQPVISVEAAPDLSGERDIILENITCGTAQTCTKLLVEYVSYSGRGILRTSVDCQPFTLLIAGVANLVRDSIRLQETADLCSERVPHRTGDVQVQLPADADRELLWRWFFGRLARSSC